MATNKTIGTLLFRIEAETKALRKGMADVNRQIGGLKKSFNMLAGVVGVAFSAQAVIRFSKEVVKLAGEMEGVSDAFSRIATPGLLKDLQEATKNTVSELDLMKRAVMAHNFQIPLEQLASLFAFATKRAQQTGESVDYLVNSIVVGIGRKSPLILDNLGISAVKLREELNRAGHSGSTVFQVAQAVGKIAQEEMSKAGDIIETTNVESEKLKATMGNVKVEIGKAAIEAFNLTANLGALNDVLQNILEKGTLSRVIELFSDWVKWGNFLVLALKASNTQIDLFGKAWTRVFGKPGKGANEYTGAGVMFDENGKPSGIDLNVAAKANQKPSTPTSPPIPGFQGQGLSPLSPVGSIGIGGMGATSPADVLSYLQDVAPSVADNITASLKRIAEQGKNLKTSFQGVKETVTKPMMELGLVVQQAFMGAVDAFGGFVESLASGDMENAFTAILKLFGGFVTQMGKMIVAYGISMIAFKKAFANPAAAIVAGLALVAIGSAISGLANRGPSMGGSGVSSGGYSQAQPVAVLKGRDIYIASTRGQAMIGGITG